LLFFVFYSFDEGICLLYDIFLSPYPQLTYDFISSRCFSALVSVAKSRAVIIQAVGGIEKYYSQTGTGGQTIDWS
jgi:hypothetical protein